MTSGPVPTFTIEDLLRNAIEAVPETEESVFTARELMKIFGVATLDTTRDYMTRLEEREGEGDRWRFLPTRKRFVNRAGISTSKSAYIVVPPVISDAEINTNGVE